MKNGNKLLKKLATFGLILATAISLGGGFLTSPIDEINAISDTDKANKTSFVKVGELYNTADQSFNADNYNILLKYLTGNSSATLANVTTLASANNNQFSSSGYIGTDASVIRAKTLTAGTQGSTSYLAKTSSKDVCVRLGGLDWQVMYLTKNTNNDTILTLWLDNNIQETWSSQSSSGTKYGFLDGGLYSEFSYNYVDSSYSSNYPAASYGTSYVHIVTLNNGGTYSTSTTATSTFTPSSSSIFATFTMPEYGLTDYLVTPRTISWQEDQSSKTILSKTYKYSNEDYTTNQSNTDYYGSYNYSGKTNYDAWADDYLWLPSISEVGQNTTYTGLWNSSIYQKQNASGSDSETTLGKVDATNDNAYPMVWVRTGCVDNANYAYYIATGGADFVWKKCSWSLAVRPALHLNLSAIDASILNDVSVGELYNSSSKTFNEENYAILLKYLTGNTDATIDTVATLAGTNNNQFSSSGYTGTDAGVIRAKTLSAGTYGTTSYAEKKKGDIIVTLGGLKWQVMYLSQSTDGDTLLTLWLDNSTQDAWTGRSSTEGTYYGYIDGGLYSMWSANYNIDNPGDAYPSNMYGTSYINTITLNNGGYCSVSGTSTGPTTKSTSSAFALFTMSQYGLTDYLATPRKVSWQENQSVLDILDSYSYRLPNEAYASNIADSEFSYDSSLGEYYNYSNKTYNDAWADGYLWLPSRSEVGNSSSDPGLWNTSLSQRQNYDGTTTTALGTVGSGGGSAYAYTYLRSGNNNSGRIVTSLSPAGLGLEGNTNRFVNYCMAVRPALHLNLSDIYDKLYGDVSVGELYDSTNMTFNEDNYNILLKYLTGNASATISTVSTLAGTNNNSFSSSGYTGTDSSYFRSKTLSAGTSGSTAYAEKKIGDIVVTLGGLKWQVVYLSKSTDGDTIVTLWLDNSTQDAWADRSNTEGDYYGFINGGLYSMWSANWINATPGTSPSNMYGTSYINAVTLNNGGYYATGNDNSASGGSAELMSSKTNVASLNVSIGEEIIELPEQPITANDYELSSVSAYSAFALFTMAEYGLTDYLVIPVWVSWQQNQSAKTLLSARYNNPNEAWSIATSDDGFYSSDYNYASKDYNDAWKHNYLWLPSLSETGYSSSCSGLWNSSISQRKNFDGSTISSQGSVGSTSGSAHPYTWLRSGFYSSSIFAYYLSTAGSGGSIICYSSVGSSYAVRPALHLNLTDIYANLNAVSLEEGGEITVSPSSATYDGLAKTPTITVKNNGTTLTAGTDYTLSYTLNSSTVSEMKEKGTYTITATGRIGYTGSISTTFVIKDAELSVTISPPNEYVTFVRGSNPTLYLQDGSYMLVLGTDYTVTHTINYDNLIGVAVIVGIGGYGGTMTINYTIILLDPVANIYLMKPAPQ